MATFNNPYAVNTALGKMGSQYRVDENGMQPTTAPQPAVQQTPAPVQVAQPAQQPAAQPTSPVAANPEAQQLGQGPAFTDEEKAKNKEGGGVETFKNLADGFKNMATSDDEAQNKGMQKVGNLVGTILSFYTGNVKGGAQGMKNMSESSK